MSRELMIPAHSVARLLSQILGPVPDPWIGPGGLGWGGLTSGPTPRPLPWPPRPWPWYESALNPQPLPPRERYVLALADAHIQELFALDRTGALLGKEVARNAEEQALRRIAEIDELCPPLCPDWPELWPPPPRPPWERKEMTPTELFLFGTRVLAGSELFGLGSIQDALAGLGAKVLDVSMNR